MNGTTVRRAALRLGVSLLVACASAPARADAATEAPPPGSALSGRHALLLFVAYRGNVPVPLHPTHLRRTASRHIADAFAEAGGTFVTYPDVEPLMRKWRVRSERDLGLPFLGELASAFDVDHVTVLKLVTYDDRIVLLGRTLSPRTGLLEWADVAEVVHGDDLWGNEADARAHLDELVPSGARTLLSGAAPVRTGASPLLTLPLLPVGLDRGETDLAWQCLLGSLLRAE
jgi:hypothetical protein